MSATTPHIAQNASISTAPASSMTSSKAVPYLQYTGIDAKHAVHCHVNTFAMTGLLPLDMQETIAQTIETDSDEDWGMRNSGSR